MLVRPLDRLLSPDSLQCLVLCMSARAECLACMCGTLNRSWLVSRVTPWGPGPIRTAKKNWIKEEEETCIRDAFRWLWETFHYLSACTAASYSCLMHETNTFNPCYYT